MKRLSILLSAVCMTAVTGFIMGIPIIYPLTMFAQWVLLLAISAGGVFCTFILFKVYFEWDVDSKTFEHSIEIKIRWVADGEWILKEFFNFVNKDYSKSTIEQYWYRMINRKLHIEFMNYSMLIRRIEFPAGIMMISNEHYPTKYSKGLLKSFHKIIVKKIANWEIERIEDYINDKDL